MSAETQNAETNAVSKPAPKKEPFILSLLRDWGLALGAVLGLMVLVQMVFPERIPSIGPAPDFTLPDLAGDAVTLSDHDDVVVLNFWFTNCPPCRAEIPELSAFAKAHPDVPMYGLSTDAMSPAQLKIAAQRLGIDYRVLHDARALVARDYEVTAFPTTLVVRDMEIVQARVGAVDQHVLEHMVTAAQ